jgi:hypothetical protein
MSASNYLPPFTTEERGAAPGDRAEQAPTEPDDTASGPEVTYADFLGDQVDDDEADHAHQ